MHTRAHNRSTQRGFKVLQQFIITLSEQLASVNFLGDITRNPTLADINIWQINQCFPTWTFSDHLNKLGILYLETVRIADKLCVSSTPLYTDAKALLDGSTAEIQGTFLSESKYYPVLHI